MLVTTAVHADCKLDDTCSTLAECKALNSNYGLNADKKCVNLAKEQKDLDDCKSLVVGGTPGAPKQIPPSAEPTKEETKTIGR